MKNLLEQVQQLQTLSQHLNEQLLNFKPGGDRWSILEIAEHLIIVEANILKMLLHSGGEKSAQDSYINEKQLKQIALNRAFKVRASERSQPKGQYSSMQSILEQLQKTREKIQEGIIQQSFDLSVESFPHMVLGPMTKKDWVNFIFFHFERHFHQMEENIAFYQNQN